MRHLDEAEHVQSEKVEKELNILIERRATACKKSAEQERIDALWRDSSELQKRSESRRIRAAWYDFHERMRETHSRLAEDHERAALKLLDEAS